MEIVIRDASDADMESVQQIYAHYVLHGLATFEEQPPTVEELIFRKQTAVKAGLPYLVAAVDQQVTGFAYASVYRPRPAYRYTVEDSVYVADGSQGQGIGSALLSAVIQHCEAGDWRQMIAVIGDSGNAGSIALHKRFGFEHTGTLQAVGFKLGRWVDTVLMQRVLGQGSRTPPRTSR